MRLRTCASLLAVLLSFSALLAQDEKTPPEAAPVIAVLKAAKASDVKGFTNAYSERIREDNNQADWEKNFKEAQGNLKKLYGEYQLKDFRFAFAGDKEKGKISFSHKDSKKLELDVVKEGAEWKLDMR